MPHTSRTASDLPALLRTLDRWGGLLLVVLIVGLWIGTRLGALRPTAEHVPPPGAHGGRVVPFASEEYHAEALFEEGGRLRLFTLGRDPSRVVDVEEQTLTAYVRTGDLDASPVELTPSSQQGDPPGRTSQFVGQLPENVQGRPVEVIIPALRIAGGRYRLAFTWSTDSDHPAMPQKRADDEERELYLVPGGKYTEADVAANGSRTASQKFEGFQAKHDFNPRPGDRLCPVTRTKAHPECDWIIDGRRYEFCCPPCVDEFVSRAKEQPDQIGPPEMYVQEELSSQSTPPPRR